MMFNRVVPGEWRNCVHNAAVSQLLQKQQISFIVLTVGKYPSVKTLNKLVLPQAPSPMMTSFLLKFDVRSQSPTIPSSEKHDRSMVTRGEYFKSPSVRDMARCRSEEEYDIKLWVFVLRCLQHELLHTFA